MKNICIYGAGGVGGYFEAKMIRNNRDHLVHISFIARGRHLERIQECGLTLIGDNETITVRPDAASREIVQVPVPDLVLLCVKGYDLSSAVQELIGVITEETVILPLLNGIDIPERIREYTSEGFVLPACVYVGTHIEEPGMIRQSGGDGRIIFGDDRQKGSMGARACSEVLRVLGIHFEYMPDPSRQIWTKYLFIAAYGMVTAASGKPLGEVYADEARRKNVGDIMAEIVLLSSKKGVVLPPNAVAQSLEKATAFPFETKTSFQRDFSDSQKKNERELFADTLVRIADVYGVDMPRIREYKRRLEE